MSGMGLKTGVQVMTGAVRKQRLSPAKIALIAVVVVFLIAVLRVVTGANDLASSGALAAAIGLAVPIGMAGLGGLWSERAGVVNIGLEGMMILGTWGAGFFGYHYGPWAGLLGAMFCGMVGGAIHALATVVFGVDHIVSGVAINIIGAGAAKYLAARTFTGTPGGGPTQSPALGNPARLQHSRRLVGVGNAGAEADLLRLRSGRHPACPRDQPVDRDADRPGHGGTDLVGAVAHDVRSATALLW